MVFVAAGRFHGNIRKNGGQVSDDTYWSKKVEMGVSDIFAIRQSPGEGLGDFLSQFNSVRVTLLNISKGSVVAAFENGLNRESSKATKKLLTI